MSESRVKPERDGDMQAMAERPGWVRPNTKAVNLALQGGGAHGAFTWGVIDQLLEDGRISFEAISGTSAGAMNAVVIADGMLRGGPEAAREALHDFWYAVSVDGAKNPVKRNPINWFLGDWSLDNSPSYLFFDVFTRMVSPYEVNPFNINPLRTLIEDRVEFERLRSCTQTKLFVPATNVHTGRVRVFKTWEMTADAVLASACLPFLFQAIEIEGVPYWDGGYMGNPVLFPFFDSCASADVLLIQINPLERRETPRTAREILNRVNEITFNASLMKEFRAIEFVSRLIESGKLDPAEYTQIKLHRVEDDTALEPLSASSKLNTEWAFFEHLRDVGREAAQRWLDENYEQVGSRSTVDIRALFQ